MCESVCVQNSIGIKRTKKKYMTKKAFWIQKILFLFVYWLCIFCGTLWLLSFSFVVFFCQSFHECVYMPSSFFNFRLPHSLSFSPALSFWDALSFFFWLMIQLFVYIHWWICVCFASPIHLPHTSKYTEICFFFHFKK